MKLLIALFVAVIAASGANAQGLSGSNPWVGQNYTPPCPLTLSSGLLSPSATSCAAGAAYGVHIQTATLSANATLKFPTGLKDGSFITFRISQDGTGGRTLTLGGGDPVGIAMSPNTVNVFTCYGYGGSSTAFTSTQLECGPVITNLNTGSPVNYIIASHNTNVCADGTSCAGSALQKTSGNKHLVATVFCSDANCSQPSATQSVSSITGTGIGSCALLTGGRKSAGNLVVEVWMCSVTATGSNAITVNYSGAVSYPQIQQVDVSGLASSPDDGVGGGAAAAGTAPSATTNGNTTRASEFVFAYMAAPFTADVFTVGNGYTAIGDAGPSWAQLAEWRTSGAAGAAQTADATLSPSDAWNEVVVSLKHP